MIKVYRAEFIYYDDYGMGTLFIDKASAEAQCEEFNKANREQNRSFNECWEVEEDIVYENLEELNRHEEKGFPDAKDNG